MTRNFYGNKMFVADLIITSFWALFSILHSLWGAWPLLIYITMRIVLCFEMKRRSPWTLYSAIAFFICYIGFTWGSMAIYPFKRLAYYIGAWTGYSADIVQYFGEGAEWEVNIWLYGFATLLNLWLMVMPIVVGICQKNISSIDWKHKWIWVYGGVTLILGAWISCYETMAGTFISGILLSVLPFAYWSIYNRKGRSAIDLLMKDRSAVAYVAFIILLTLCIFIGKCEEEFVKAIGLLVMPPVFYVLICKCCNYKPLTRHAVALSLCGILYLFIFHAPEWFKILSLSLSAVLALYVAVDTYRKHKGKWISAALFITPVFVVSPLVLGINPYAALDSEFVSKYHNGYYGSDGVYVIGKYSKYDLRDCFGLRDRYGIILESEYNEFSRMDKWGRYVRVLTGPNTLIAKNRYGVFDMASRQFVLDPESIDISEMIQIGEKSFKLVSPNGRHFATLLLPGWHEDKNKYIQSVTIEPHHASTELVMEESHEYDSEAEEFTGSTEGYRAESYILLDSTRVATNRKFKEIIDKSEDYRNIYNRWAELIESMSGYLVDVTYGEPWYSMQPLQYNSDIRLWVEAATSDLDLDCDILFKEKIYTSKGKNHVSDSYIDKFFRQFEPTTPGGYNRMWNEVKPALFEWRFARKKYAEDLTPHQRLSFEEHTTDMTDYFMKEIEGLIETRNDNVIWDREHPNE